MKFRYLILSLMLLIPNLSIGSPYRLAFGSCNKQEYNQDLWSDVIQAKPAMFMWIGDAIYGNGKDAKSIEESFLSLYNHPQYRKFRTAIPVVGSWDDHDYGLNNSGAENPIKKEVQQLYLNFIGEPPTSSRRTQEGLYTSYDINHEGLKIKMILLDTRYFRGKPMMKLRGSPAERKSEMLGETQWKWLEQILDDSQADLHLVVSGTSVLSPHIPQSEQWENFPQEMDRLFRAIQKRKTKNVVFLTGDRHFAGVIERKVNGISYIELMSSGMNFGVRRFVPKPVIQALYKGRSWFDPHVGILDITKHEKEIEVQYRNLSVGPIMRDRYSLRMPY
jgi:alkaline phosphatase D